MSPVGVELEPSKVSIIIGIAVVGPLIIAMGPVVFTVATITVFSTASLVASLSSATTSVTVYVPAIVYACVMLAVVESVVAAPVASSPNSQRYFAITPTVVRLSAASKMNTCG